MFPVPAFFKKPVSASALRDVAGAQLVPPQLYLLHDEGPSGHSLHVQQHRLDHRRLHVPEAWPRNPPFLKVGKLVAHTIWILKAFETLIVAQ